MRTERHIPNSIATMRRRLIVALAKPCRDAPAVKEQRQHGRSGEICDTVKLTNRPDLPRIAS